MKKLITMGMIVGLAVLVGLSTVSLAADQPAKQELNQDLNQDLNGDTRQDAESDSGVTDDLVPVLGDRPGQDNPELNNTNSRESSSLAAKRGRQPRRGSTAQVVADQQAYWGDNKSGKDNEGNDDNEGQDDENPPMTPVGPM
jgi:hypothetical protein